MSQIENPTAADILRATQEGQPGDVPAPLPPLSDAPGDLDLREIHSGRPRHPRQPHQQRRPRGHVLLLHARGGRTRVREVPLVEEAPHYRAAGECIR